MNDIKKLIQMLKEYQKPYIGHDYIFYGIEFCNPQVQMCLDGFEKLDEKMQKQVIDICEQNDIQAFMTVTEFTGDEQFVIENMFKEEK